VLVCTSRRDDVLLRRCPVIERRLVEFDFVEFEERRFTAGLLEDFEWCESSEFLCLWECDEVEVELEEKRRDLGRSLVARRGGVARDLGDSRSGDM
jgi:hypothetical protein